MWKNERVPCFYFLYFSSYSWEKKQGGDFFHSEVYYYNHAKHLRGMKKALDGEKCGKLKLPTNARVTGILKKLPQIGLFILNAKVVIFENVFAILVIFSDR